jgi:putative oxidoreductase
VEAGGGLAVLFGLFTRPAAAALAGFCLITALIFHFVPGDQNQMVNFFKNICMAGGFLQLAAFGAGQLSLDALRARRRA